MCKHSFDFPPDIKENYNLDGKTLTGVCRYCGAKEIAYGMRWTIPFVDKFSTKPHIEIRDEENYLPYKF